MIKEIDVLDTNPFAKRIEYLDNNKTIAFLEYSLIYDRMEINNIKVQEEYQNQGIGSKLMGYLISIAIIEHVVNITLEVRLSNDKARHLYSKFGFREVALRKFYYGDEDGILMEKQVM
jgi:ribosomal-protein-alanine N-acetyltransferase